MAGRKTDTDDLVERLEDSKGWPNLGKAAAARIRELEAENTRLRKALEGIKMTHWECGTWECVAKRQEQYARAALEEKNDD